MQQPLANLEVKVLEKMYLREIEVLKRKMLIGAFKKDIVKQENKTIEIAMAIHRRQYKDAVVCSDFSVKVV